MAKRELKILSKDAKDLRHRILFTLFCLGIYCLGTGITIVWATPWLGTLYGELDFLGVFNLMSGGGFERFSIFGLGVTPYINASIVTQLLTMDIIPYFADLAKQGQTGRNKINQITRVLGIALAFVQGYMFSFAFIQDGTVTDYMEAALVMTAGTSLLLWIGDLVTKKGLGNGTSMIIMAGILASTPYMFTQAFEGLVTVDAGTMGVIKFILFIVLYLFIVLGVLFVQLAERRIPIQYANKSDNVFANKQTYMPFKLNSAGVVPVIFASALISAPALIAQFSKNEGMMKFVNNWLSLTSVTGFLLFIILIVAFSFFYTFIVIKPKEMAENLQKSGGYIPGVRPGDETIKYVSKVLLRLTVVGSVFLAIIAGLPYVFSMVSDLPSTVSIGGTGLLIVIGVILEVYKQLESSLISRSYRRRRFQ